MEASSLPAKDMRGYGPLSEWAAVAHDHVVSGWARARPSSGRHFNHTQRLASWLSGRWATAGGRRGMADAEGAAHGCRRAGG